MAAAAGAPNQALVLTPRGTVRAIQPIHYYRDGQTYRLNGEDYIVVKTKIQLQNLVAQSHRRDLSKVVTTFITDMSYLFDSKEQFNQNISSWDVSNVTDMESMFNYAKSFNQPIGNWDVSNVEHMDYMFQGAESFNQPIGDWDVSNVEHMRFMFSYADSFNQPIDKWDVSNVRDMVLMFGNAVSFDQKLESWGNKLGNDVIKIGMFANSGICNPISWHPDTNSIASNNRRKGRCQSKILTQWKHAKDTQRDAQKVSSAIQAGAPLEWLSRMDKAKRAGGLQTTEKEIQQRLIILSKLFRKQLQSQSKKDKVDYQHYWLDTQALINAYNDYIRNKGASIDELGRRAYQRELEASKMRTTPPGGYSRRKKQSHSKEEKKESKKAASGGGGGSSGGTKGGRRVSRKFKSKSNNRKISKRYSKRR